MRNERFQEFRESLKDKCRYGCRRKSVWVPERVQRLMVANAAGCRFCLGSNKVMQVALGKDAETEVQDGLAELAPRISGSVGLLFTSLPQEEVSLHAWTSRVGPRAE